MKKADRFWSYAAKSYLTEYSASLRRELENLQEPGTPRADLQVQGYVVQMRRKSRRKKQGMLVAACLVLVLLLPMLLRGGFTLAGPGGGVLPLSFPLPTRFTVSAAELDRGKTVYSLEDRYGDPVVMTLEKGGDTAFFRELAPVTIGGELAYVKTETGYNLLAFQRRGILYVLTCQYDLDTLASLSRAIPS